MPEAAGFSLKSVKRLLNYKFKSNFKGLFSELLPLSFSSSSSFHFFRGRPFASKRENSHWSTVINAVPFFSLLEHNSVKVIRVKYLQLPVDR